MLKHKQCGKKETEENIRKNENGEGEENKEMWFTNSLLVNGRGKILKLFRRKKEQKKKDE